MTGGARMTDISETVERSAWPSDVKATLARLTEHEPNLEDRLAQAPEVATKALVNVISASRSLARLFEMDPLAIEVIFDLKQVPDLTIESPEDLVRWKQLEFLRIAARDLTGLDTLAETGLALSHLASRVLRFACSLARIDGLCVIGMGKLGGVELNYSSDVDIMFVGDGPSHQLEPQARAVIEIARSCFRIDTNLRPEGRDGALVRSTASYEAYWERWAEPWEFQALIKAVPVAGDMELGAAWFAAVQEHLWSHQFTADELRSLRALKARAEAEVARRGLTGREIKRGPGGIRDIEFTVQLLQLVHGHADPGLRSPTTLITLTEMAHAGYIDPGDAEKMANAYDLLRRIEHRLQLVDGQQVHTMPTDRDSLTRLARVLGYRDRVDGDARVQLEKELRLQQVTVRAIHDRVYFRPLLEAFADTEGGLSPDVAAHRLSAFGFVDAERTRTAVRDLTSGLNRASRLMQQLLPLLLDWLSHSPDPDLGLLVLQNLLSGRVYQRQLVDAFRESPEAARRLCLLAGTSRMLGDIITRNPDLVPRLPHEEQLRTRPRDELIASALEAVSWRSDVREQQEALRRWKDRHLVGIASRAVMGMSDVDAIGHDLTSLAEACLDAALTCLEPAIPFSVIALGRFGGAELSYASDLDVLFVYEGSGAANVDEANRIATGLRRFISGSTPAERIFEIDLDLRPEGKAGALARDLDGYRTYWNTSAQTWERLAMVRARPVAGNLDLGTRLIEMLEPDVWGGGLSGESLREIRRVKARIENERIPANEDPQFHLKLGRGSLSDIEFTAQTLQLTHGIHATGTIDALRDLTVANVLTVEDAGILTDAYRFCELVRNRLMLVLSKPTDALPAMSEELTWLARSLETTPSSLRDHYRKVTRRARRVVERVFYGQV